MTTLNGLPRSWDAFIQGICARKKLVKFSRLWEECFQEEARIAAREEKMGSEDQALTVHSKSHSKSNKRRPHSSRGKHSHKDNTRRDVSRIICSTCDETGHYARNCPDKQKIVRKSNKRRHHAHAAEDDEPSRKRSRYESEYSSSKDEYVLISALTGNITHGSDDWLIDSSKHMTGFKESFVILSEHE